MREERRGTDASSQRTLGSTFTNLLSHVLRSATAMEGSLCTVQYSTTLSKERLFTLSMMMTGDASDSHSAAMNEYECHSQK